MHDHLADAKQELRQRMLKKLQGLPREAKVEAEEALRERIGGHSAFKYARALMMYMALPTETSLIACIQMAWQAGKTVALPRVSGRELKPYRINNLEGDLTEGAYNVQEPRPHCDRVALEDLDLVIVPGIAFDRLGWRLGRGKGFYDRFLNTLPENCHTVGVCHKIQLLESVPYGPNDICVKEVIAV